MINKDEVNSQLSDYIRLMRQKHKLSQEELATKLNVTRQCYQNWEYNPTKLSLDQLIQIGAILGENILLFFDSLSCKMQQKE